jgi:hypothetical protein
MADTVHQALLQLIQPRLLALASVPASRVFVERVVAVDAEDCPAINILPGETRFESLGKEDDTFDMLRATMAFSLRVHTRGSPHTQAADPTIGQAHAALMADPSLGGVALRLLLRFSRPSQAPADGTAGTYELGYEAVVLVDERTLGIKAL